MRKTPTGATALIAAWIALFCPPPFPGTGDHIGASSARAAEEFGYHDDEILFHFSQEKNMVHFNHLIGMLSDLWREHKKFYEAKGAGEDAVSPKVEELINDANLAGSEKNYEEAFAILKNAYGLLKASLIELGIQAK